MHVEVEDNLWGSVLSFHHVGPGGQIRAVRLGHSHPLDTETFYLPSRSNLHLLSVREQGIPLCVMYFMWVCVGGMYAHVYMCAHVLHGYQRLEIRSLWLQYHVQNNNGKMYPIMLLRRLKDEFS